jgi:diaminohydroxyphosphoribosylaminopyrimidine deaminase/5-amino-6-(5-phosphoribosylamino)uracil reductase
MERDEIFMHRCFDLARLGLGFTAPNPPVGAVLVYDGHIIGEGYHQRHGHAHAEVNAIKSVPVSLQHLIPKSTLYVSLEPCCITGQTGACTSLILANGIRDVVISCLDQSPGVAGQGVFLLRESGVSVRLGVLQAEGEYLVRIRNHFVTQNRPFVIAKYAMTPGGLFAPEPQRQFWITNPLTRRFVHRLRSTCDAILVGTQTALTDNPGLDNRFFPGPSPLRIVLDRNLRLPPHLTLFDGRTPTLVINGVKNKAEKSRKLEWLKLDFNAPLWPALLSELYTRKISSLLVEGGASVLNSLFESNLWEEAWEITGANDFPTGIPAPRCHGTCIHSGKIGEDTLRLYKNSSK